jgi:hypothetical protein
MIIVKDGRFHFNGKRKEIVWGRSSFKLSNVLTYHWTGQGGGKYSLGAADRWIAHNQALFGEDVLLRVFLETAGWTPCTDCMFGSEPRDQGFWEVQALRDGNRETAMHGVGKNALEWFFKTSESTGCAFELVIDATLKHNNIPKGEIDHVIRVTGIEMGNLSARYPKALIIPNMRNEWNAHNGSGHTLQEVNMWAVRWDRDGYWPEAPKVVCPGGGNEFTYDVGPEPGKYRAGFIHPERGPGWETFPNQNQLVKLRADSRGMPVGFNESMYYVEVEDAVRAARWYRADGWTTNWGKYAQFLQHVEASGVNYFVIHDEKGVQCDPDWPRKETRVEAWARGKFGGVVPGPPTPPPTQVTSFTVRRDDDRELVIERDPEVVKGGDESFVLRDSCKVDVKHGGRLKRLHVFHGLDRGDTVEMDTEIHADGQTLYVRSEHKEGPSSFDAYETVEFGQDEELIQELVISAVCRVTGKRPDGLLQARPHWGIRFVWRQ